MLDMTFDPQPVPAVPSIVPDFGRAHVGGEQNRKLSYGVVKVPHTRTIKGTTNGYGRHDR